MVTMEDKTFVQFIKIITLYAYTYKYDQKLCDQPNYSLEGSLVAKFLNGIVCYSIQGFHQYRSFFGF